MPQTFNVGSRSLFVTATAWVFIVLAVLASLSALVQNAAVASLAPEVAALVSRGSLSAPGRLMLAYLPWVVGAGVLLSVATLASAIGLLLRLDWARRVFIALLLVAIAANLLGLWLQQEVVQSVADAAVRRVALPPQALGVFGGFVTATRVMAVLMTLAACSMLGWIVRRLMSPGVRQEFG